MIAIQQLVVPHYRNEVFKALSNNFYGKISILNGNVSNQDSIVLSESGDNFYFKTKNLYFGFGSLKLIYQKGVINWLHRVKPKLIIMDTNPRIISNQLIIKYAKKNNIKVVGWGLGHLGSHGNIFSSISFPIAIAHWNSFDGFLCYSSKAKRDYEHSIVDNSNIKVIYNSINTNEIFSNIEQLKKDISWEKKYINENKLDLDSFKILFVGRLIKQKKIEKLIYACANINSNIELLIIGSGDYESNLKKICSDYNISTTFLGFKNGIDLSKAFLISKLMVLPSYGGLTINTAMCHKIPVIISRADGTELDLIQNKQTGYYYNGSVNDLKNKIQYAINNYEHALECAERSYNMIMEKFNFNKYIERYSSAIKSYVKNI